MSSNMSKQVYDSLLTGAAFAGANVILDGQAIDKKLAMLGAASAGCEYISNFVTDMVNPILQPLVPSNFSAMENRLINPLVSGGVYVLVDKYGLKQDYHSDLQKFLYQAGCSALVDMAEGVLFGVAYGSSPSAAASPAFPWPPGIRRPF